MRLSALIAALCFSTAAMSALPSADAVIRKATRIPAQDLGSALVTLERDRNLQVVFISEDVKNLKTHGASGQLSFEEALQKILEGTGLTYKYLDRGTVTVLPTAPGIASTNDVAATGTGSPSPASQAQGIPVRLAQTEAVSQRLEESPIQEVVVTAQKRNQRLLDVPVPVTVLNADSLVTQNQTRFQDYFSSVPGLNFSSGNRGDIFPSIRGITTGNYAAPTVGIVVDDVPFGSTTTTFSAPDIDPSDLVSVEVLRGPQGTLYGASSLGGLIKYVTIDPNTDRLSGRVEVGASAVRNGTGAGFSLHGSVNVPLSSTLALRASAYGQQTPGYIDNPVTGENGLNKTHDYGGRLAALWKPSDDFSVKLSALIQRLRADGESFMAVEPGFRDLQQNFLIGTGSYEKNVNIFSVTLKGRVGDIDLASITGYNDSNNRARNDVSNFDGAVVLPIFGVSGVAFVEETPTTKFSQEVRLSSNFGKVADWILGGYYTHEKFRENFNFPVVDPANGRTVGSFGTGTLPNTYTEYAAFADVTVHTTARSDIQFGARQSHDQQNQQVSVDTGLFGSRFFGADPYFSTAAGESESPFTWLITPQFKITPDVMLYARVATGFRPGGGNLQGAQIVGAPSTYGPDRTLTYEVGAKGTLLEHALTFDLSVYHVDWKDIQLALQTPTGQGYFANGGKAKSQGIELSAEIRPVDHLKAGFWVSMGEPVLTKSFPANSPAYGADGDPLPYASRRSGNASLDYDFPLGTELTGQLGGVVTYVGEREGNFQGTRLRQIFPSYTKADVRMGALYRDWTLSLFANNITDRRGAVGGGFDSYHTGNPLLYIQPRTVGLSLAKDF